MPPQEVHAQMWSSGSQSAESQSTETVTKRL